MKKLSSTLLSFLLIMSFYAQAQQTEISSKSTKWAAELNLLWPIFPGNIYKGQVAYEFWRTDHLAGEAYLGFHIRPFEFRPTEGDFSNYALTWGYRQYFGKGFHLEVYQAFGPGFNRNNAIDGQDYTSWDYELGFLAGYRWEFLSESKRTRLGVSPYLSTQHGFYYLAAQSNPHPIIGSTGELPFYVGTLNIGLRF